MSKIKEYYEPKSSTERTMKYFLMAALVAMGQYSLFSQQFTPELAPGVYARIYTNKGEILASLDYKNVPMTVANFVGLAEGTIDNEAFGLGRPYYTGSKWHRVVPGHVIQGGSPNVQGRAGTGYAYPNEIYEGLSHIKAGMLGIANAGPHTNGSQFYITLGDRSYLDGNYTLFGEVVRGMNVVNDIIQGDVIERIEIERIGRRAERFLPVTRTFLKMVNKAKDRVEKLEEQKKKQEDLFIIKTYPDAVWEHNDVVQSIIEEGSRPINSGQTIKIRYTGRVLMDGVSFVSTESGDPLDNQEPTVFEYTVGSSKINSGLDWLIPQMKVGDRRVVILPSKMAYGRGGHYGPYKPKNQRFVINPNSRLFYEIEIIDSNN